MKKLRRLCAPINRKFLLAASLSGIALAMSVGLLGTSAWLISMASMQPPVLVLEVAIVSVRFFGLARGFFRYYGRLQEHGLVLNLQTKVRSALYAGFERHLPAEFFGIKRGALLYRTVTDSETVLDLWIRILSPWLASVISGAAGVGIIFYLLPKAGIIIGAIFITTVTIAPFFSYQLSRSEEKSEVQENLLAILISTFDSLPESIIFNRTEDARARVSALQSKLDEVERSSSTSAGLGDALMQFSTGLTVMLGLLFAANAFTHHNIAGVNVAVITLLPLAIFDGTTGLSAAFAELSSILASAKRIESGLTDATESEQGTPVNHIDSLHVSDFLPFHLQGKIQPISFTGTSAKPIIICAPSGAGKSSIVHALAGLSQFQGSIEVDGAEVAALTPELLTVGLQEDHLFQSSIRENLRIAREGLGDREIMQMMEVVELAELINSLPQGLDTHIGPFGHNFSGGERQRLKLARVLLRHTPIFILDEPFEYLDSRQARRIAKRVVAILSSKILIIVSHLDLEIDGEHLHLSK